MKNMYVGANSIRPQGISLITLIITIIVIIILASVVIFTGLNTPDRAGFARFVSEIEDVQTYVTNTIANEKGNNIIKGTVKSDAQLAYMIATGTTASSVPASPTAAGTVSGLGKTILPSSLQGTNFYEITNTEVWSSGKTYYGSDEKHYITDKGEVFILPGYLEDEDGTEKWYVNQNKYYTGDAIDISSLGSASSYGVIDGVLYTQDGREFDEFYEDTYYNPDTERNFEGYYVRYDYNNDGFDDAVYYDRSGALVYWAAETGDS